MYFVTGAGDLQHLLMNETTAFIRFCSVGCILFAEYSGNQYDIIISH
jgi:hypothetical protein